MSKPKAKAPVAAKGEKKSLPNFRAMSLDDRTKMFLARKQKDGDDYRVITEDTDDTLIPINRLPLDHGLGLEGIAFNGTMYEFHGDEGSGKSSVVIDILNELMRATGEPIAFMDHEKRLQKRYLQAQGFNMSMAELFQPDSIDESTQRAIDYLQQGVRIFAFDSIPRMKPMVSIEDIKKGRAFAHMPGRHSAAMQQFYDAFLPYLAKANGVVFMVNQTRSRIEMTHEAEMAAKGYATVTNLNYSLPGGRATRYYASVMVENTKTRAWRPGKHEDPFAFESESNQDYVCLEIKHRTLKNTITGSGFRESRSYIRNGLGIDENIAIRLMAREQKVINWSGKYYYIGAADIDSAYKVFDSKAEAIKLLVNDEDEELLAKVKELTIEKLKTYTGNNFVMDDDTQRYLAGENNHPTDEINGIEVEDVDTTDL